MKLIYLAENGLRMDINSHSGLVTINIQAPLVMKKTCTNLTLSTFDNEKKNVILIMKVTCFGF